MRKWIIAFFVIIALYAGAWSYVWWGPPQLRLTSKYDLAFKFANNIHVLVAKNSGRLPVNWAEFETWQQVEDGAVIWTEEGTSSRLMLLRPPFEIIDNIPRYIRVIDPDLKKMEDYINLRIDDAIVKKSA